MNAQSPNWEAILVAIDKLRIAMIENDMVIANSEMNYILDYFHRIHIELVRLKK